MKKALERPDLPERMQYTKYYEHDGMLRAYANRAMVMAMLFAALAIGSLGFAIYVRVQPPTVIRVNKDGESSAVRATGEAASSAAASPIVSAQAASEVAPTEIEARAVVRRFLENYLAYTPVTVDQNVATALNMMTGNLRIYSLGKLRDEDTIGKIKYPIKNFRFNETPVKMLNNIDAMSPIVRITGSERVGEFFPILAPALKVRDFSFTSLSDAV